MASAPACSPTCGRAWPWAFVVPQVGGMGQGRVSSHEPSLLVGRGRGAPALLGWASALARQGGWAAALWPLWLRPACARAGAQPGVFPHAAPLRALLSAVRAGRSVGGSPLPALCCAPSRMRAAGCAISLRLVFRVSAPPAAYALQVRVSPNWIPQFVALGRPSAFSALHATGVPRVYRSDDRPA